MAIGVGSYTGAEITGVPIRLAPTSMWEKCITIGVGFYTEPERFQNDIYTLILSLLTSSHKFFMVVAHAVSTLLQVFVNVLSTP